MQVDPKEYRKYLIKQLDEHLGITLLDLQYVLGKNYIDQLCHRQPPMQEVLDSIDFGDPKWEEILE